MVCLRNMCVNTLHKGDNDDDDNNNNNHNNHNHDNHHHHHQHHHHHHHHLHYKHHNLLHPTLLILPPLPTLLHVSRIRTFPILSSLFISETTLIYRPLLLIIQGFFWQRTSNSLHKIILTIPLFIFFFIYHIYSYFAPHTFLKNFICVL